MTNQQNPTNKQKAQEEVEPEKQLLPRLRFMGLLLLFFSVCTLCYSIFFTETVSQELSEQITTDDQTNLQEMEFTSGVSMMNAYPYDFIQVERFNAYIVTISFALVGAACVITAWHKQKKYLRK